jgi:large subunit ribosomal protein L7e
LKRAEKYVNEYEKEKKKQEFLKYQAMKVGNFYVAPEPKIAFVVRIRGLKDISPRVRKALQLMRLRQINTGVFIKLNKAALSLLKIVEPFVAWGYPDLDTVKKLIYKRAHVKVNGTRTPILGNGIIEEHLGKYNIICVEDLIHEIWTVGPHFKEANNFLWPFKLHSPRGGYKSIKKHFIEGGAYGNREEYINELIAAML